MSWLNPWSWNPDAVDRFELRISGFFRWLVVLLTVGAAVGFLAWFGVSAANDVRLSRHGAVVRATVEDTVSSGRDTRYLLSFVVDGQAEAQWSGDVRGLKVGDSVSVIVDRTDHSNFEPTSAYGSRWGGYVNQLLASVAFASLAVMFIRMDAAGFRWYLRVRYGHATGPYAPAARHNAPAGRRKGRTRRERRVSSRERPTG